MPTPYRNQAKMSIKIQLASAKITTHYKHQNHETQIAMH